jgi:hypothetical protein
MKLITSFSQFIQVTFLLFSFMLLAACSTIKAKKPSILIDEIQSIEQPVSVIKLPLEINLKPLLSEAEKEVPTKMTGEENKCDGVSYSYRFERNPIEFKGKNDKLAFSVDGKYALKVNYCPKCTDLFQSKPACIIPRVYVSCGEGEPMRRIKVGFETKIDFTADYKLKSKTELTEVKTLDPCQVTFVNYDASKQVVKEVETALKDMAKEIDKKVQTTDVKKEINDAWKTLQTPISLGEYGFLYITPEKISLGKPIFDNQKLKIDLDLEVKPTISTEIITKIPSPLPPLSNPRESEGFQIFLNLEGSYDSINRILNTELKGKEIDFKKRKIILENIQLHGANKSQMQFEISFSGSKKGILYLVGTPVYSIEKETISFSDVQFDIQSKDALLKSAKWMFNDRISSMIEKSARYSLKNELKELKAKVDAELNKSITKDIRLQGKIEQIEITKIQPLENKLIIQTFLNGKLAVYVF